MEKNNFWYPHWRYFLGVGIGLVIAWVTGALAYFKVGASSFMELILFELILSVILILVAAVLRLKEK